MFNRLSAAAVAVSIALTTGPAHGQELQAINNFYHEMAECVAFYSSIAACSAKDGSKLADLTEKAEKAADSLLTYYLIPGETLGITNDAAECRVV